MPSSTRPSAEGAIASSPEGRRPPKIVTRDVPGPRARKLAARLRRVECPAFEARRARRAAEHGGEEDPIVYARAKGANVYDADGNRFVDLAAGFGALPLGHAPAAVDRAVRAQAARLALALGDVYGSEPKALLAEELVSLFGGAGRVLFGLSGADAVTAALKTALLATGKPGLVAFRGAYHGLSYAPLAACGLSDGFRAPFEEQLGKFVSFAPYPATADDLDRTLSVVRALLRSGSCGAVLAEPILGRGGCIVPPPAFLPELRRACDEAGALLVADEIWTGLGRSGDWLASRAPSVMADVVCLGKGLGGGLPISACVGTEAAMHAWSAHGGTAIHTATHFGAPVACAAALATLSEIRRRRLPERARRVGEAWRKSILRDKAMRGVREVTGRGLMLGVHVEGGAARALAVVRALLRRGYIVLTGGVSGDALTLTPPLDVPEELLRGFVPALSSALEETARFGWADGAAREPVLSQHA